MKNEEKEKNGGKKKKTWAENCTGLFTFVFERRE